MWSRDQLTLSENGALCLDGGETEYDLKVIKENNITATLDSKETQL